MHASASVLGQYRIRDRLLDEEDGRGTLLAEAEDGKEVVLKRVQRNSASEEELREELQLYRLLGHPSIDSSMFLVEDARPDLYVGRDYATGPLLSSRLPVPADEVDNIILEIARGLAYLHSRDPVVPHGGLKLENISMGSRLKLLDLGKHVPRAQSGGGVYHSPERIQGRDYGWEDDMWALGVVMAELLSGQRASAVFRLLPASGALPSELPPAAVHECVSGLRNELVLQLLAFDPNDRPCAGAVLERLGDFSSPADRPPPTFEQTRPQEASASVSLPQSSEGRQAACDEDREELLVASVYEANLARVEELLRNGVDPNDPRCKDASGTSPQRVACQMQLPSILEKLLEYGADVEDPDRAGMSLLALCCFSQHGDCASVLLEHKAKVDRFDNATMTPLAYAATCGAVDIMRLLLRHGARVETEGELHAPIALACTSGNVECVRFLLEHGAPVGVNRRLDDFRTTYLHTACENGYTELAALLLEHGESPNAQDWQGRTPFHFALENDRSIDCLRLLLDHGAAVNQPNPGRGGLTPLHIACKRGSMELLSLCLDHGAAVDSLGASHGDTPLVTALRNGHMDCARLLLERKADVDCRNSRGDTALHIACRTGDTASVRMLLEYGASVDTPGSWHGGSTPLFVACRGGHLEIAQLLLDSKATVDAKTSEGATPLHRVSQHGPVDAVDLLLERGACIDLPMENGMTPLHLACQSNQLECVRRLLDRGAVSLVESRSHRGETPLRIACKMNFLDCARLLLEAGAPIQPGEHGDLWFACQVNLAESAKLLIDHGARVDEIDQDGRTALHVACTHGAREVVLALLERGADPRARRPGMLTRIFRGGTAASCAKSDPALAQCVRLAERDLPAGMDALRKLIAT